MKKTMAFLIGAAIIIGTAIPALATDQNIGDPMIKLRIRLTII
ncbi:hypothetical protein [Clostridium sp.]